MFKIFTKYFFLLLFLTAHAFTCPCFLNGQTYVQGISKPITFTPRDKPKLCLTMIVKNESRIIERCLNSVKDIVDCISICDTGSTDNTVQIIEQFMQTHSIPGKVHHHTWKNFGHNRTLSAQAAQQTIQELHFPLPMTYLLLLDADMILKVEPLFSRKNLTADTYMLLQQTPFLSYYNTRLIRASLPWECVGVTHEYWDCKQPYRKAQLQTLVIDDHNDGGCKADKFERDIRLLTQGLIDEPNNERYMFYLARSYDSLNDYDNAIQWYKNRIDKGGWKEEVWYAMYSIGNCYKQMGSWDHALRWYLDAYQHSPERAEPLQKIAEYYRFNEQYYLAYLFAKEGAGIPYPKNHLLFVAHPVYHYQLDEEISVAAYYTPSKQEGLAAAERLVLRKGIPQHVKNRTYKNLHYYAQNLKNARLQPLALEQPSLSFIPSSIEKTKDGYAIVWEMPPSEKDSINQLSEEKKGLKNFLVHYDPDFKELSQKEISENSKKIPDSIKGEKNWLAFVQENELYVIDRKDPLIIYKINQENGDYNIFLRHEASHDFSPFQVSAAPVAFDEGYLFLVNQRVEDNQQYDLHRFLYLDKDFKTAKLSKPFIFQNQGVEMCRGMTLDHTGKKCVIPVSFENQKNALVFIDLTTIQSLLEPLP